MNSRALWMGALIACWVAGAGQAAAGTVYLLQGGWTFGGPLSISFDGQDSNSDGQIDDLEISAFSATYQLPLGGETIWSITDLQPGGFLFAGAGDFLFFATNPDYTLIDSAFNGLVSASVVDSFLFPIDLTEDVPTAVPEPGGLGAFGLALIAGLLWRHRAVWRTLVSWGLAP